MSSKADRKRRRRARTVTLAREGAALIAAPATEAPRPTAVIRVLDRRPKATPRDDGLERLRAKGRLGPRRFWAGRTYGVIERTASLPDGASIRSFLNMQPPGGAGGGLPGVELAGAEWVTECRWRLADAQAALNWEPGTIAILGLICGRGWHPREISSVQREAEQIETVLGVALDMLDRHWREQGFRGVGDWPAAEPRLAGIK